MVKTYILGTNIKAYCKLCEIFMKIEECHLDKIGRKICYQCHYRVRTKSHHNKDKYREPKVTRY